MSRKRQYRVPFYLSSTTKPLLYCAAHRRLQPSLSLSHPLDWPSFPLLSLHRVALRPCVRSPLASLLRLHPRSQTAGLLRPRPPLDPRTSERERRRGCSAGRPRVPDQGRRCRRTRRRTAAAQHFAGAPSRADLEVVADAALVGDGNDGARGHGVVQERGWWRCESTGGASLKLNGGAHVGGFEAAGSAAMAEDSRSRDLPVSGKMTCKDVTATSKPEATRPG
ncbi:unnamed protein product [Urochloa humidicola]